MATPPIPAPPIRGGDQPEMGPSQTTPMMASPTPGMSSPQNQRAAFQILQIVQNTRALAMQFPSAAPEVKQINDLLEKLQMKIAQQTSAGEPAAPPIGS